MSLQPARLDSLDTLLEEDNATRRPPPQIAVAPEGEDIVHSAYATATATPACFTEPCLVI